MLLTLLSAAVLLALAAPAPASAKPLVYPAGACVANAPRNNPCVSPQTCTVGPCSALTYASADPRRNTTYAVKDFGLGCDLMEGCSPCALWMIQKHKCDPGNQEECTKRPADGVVVILAKESNAQNQLCFTYKHWMVLPIRPCPGIETYYCTNSRASQKYWQTAWLVGLEKQYPSSGRYDDGRLWGVLLNPTVGRSQHQMHLRIADLKTDRNDVVEQFVNVTEFSTDPKAPTLTAAGGGQLFASVFVAARSDRRIGGTVKPFATGAIVANAGRAGAPYGLLLTKHAQRRNLNRPNARVVGGFVVTAFFNLRGSLLLDETTNDARCPPDACSPWKVGAASSGGAVGSVAGWGADYFYD